MDDIKAEGFEGPLYRLYACRLVGLEINASKTHSHHKPSSAIIRLPGLAR